MKQQHSMREVILDKVTVNICVGNDKQAMNKAEKLIKLVTNKTPVYATAKRRLATWQLRPGVPIGYKVTLRGNDAKEFLGWVLKSKNNTVSKSSLDETGNFSLGVPEYLDLPGMKYDAEIGIMGFELMATFTRPGFRIKNRRLRKSKIPKRHKVTQEEVMEFMKENFGAEVK